MSRPAAPLDPAPDVRGRAVVWAAGTPLTPGRARTGRSVGRRLGLVLVSVAAVVFLAYAVQGWEVLTPPPAGAALPLWLPDQLHAGDLRRADDPETSSRTAAARTPGDRVPHAGATVPTARPRPAAPRGGQPSATTRPTTSGHGPTTFPSGHGSSRGPGSDDATEHAGSGRPSSSSSGRGRSGGSEDSGGSSGRDSSGGSHGGDADEHGLKGGSGRGGPDDGEGGKGGKGGKGNDDKDAPSQHDSDKAGTSEHDADS